MAFHEPFVQATATKFNYAPLPPPLLTNVDATLRSLQCEGKPILE